MERSLAFAFSRPRYAAFRIKAQVTRQSKQSDPTWLTRDPREPGNSYFNGTLHVRRRGTQTSELLSDESRHKIPLDSKDLLGIVD